VILHVAVRSDWDQAVTAGESYAPPAFAAEGFIHLSVGRQLRSVLRRFFAGAQSLVLLAVDEQRLDGVPLRWEPGGDDRFPHVHGRLPLDAVTAVAPLPDRPESAVALGPAAARLCSLAIGDETPGMVTWPAGGVRVTTDMAALDRQRYHGALRCSYWSPRLPRDVFDRAVGNSLCFTAVAADGAAVGFCRLVTDRAVHAHLVDVVVLSGHRGRGIGTLLVRCALDHPDLQGVRRWTLDTRDAHPFYARLGFIAETAPGTHMSRVVAAEVVYADDLPPPFDRG